MIREAAKTSICHYRKTYYNRRLDPGLNSVSRTVIVILEDKMLLALLLPVLQCGTGDTTRRLTATPDQLVNFVTNGINHYTSVLDTLTQDRERDVAFVFGNSGAGKTTLMHYLANIPLQVVERMVHGVLEIYIAPTNPEDQSIGYLGGGSTTLIPRRIEIGGQIFYDLPGFNDTRSQEQNLINAAFIQKFFAAAERIKCIFVMDHRVVFGDNGQALMAFVDKIRGLFPDSQTSSNIINQSSLFVITKDTRGTAAEMSGAIGTLVTNQGLIGSFVTQNKFLSFSRPLNGILNQGNQEEILGKVHELPANSRGNAIQMEIFFPPNIREDLSIIFGSVMERELSNLLVHPAMAVDALNIKIAELTDQSWLSSLENRIQSTQSVKILQGIGGGLYQDILPIFRNHCQQSVTSFIEQLRVEKKTLEGIVETKNAEVRTAQLLAECARIEEETRKNANKSWWIKIRETVIKPIAQAAITVGGTAVGTLFGQPELGAVAGGSLASSIEYDK